MGVFFVNWFKIVAVNVEVRSGNGRNLAATRGEAEARKGLFAAAGGFIEDGAVDFGDYCVFVAAAVHMVGGGRGGGAEGERIEFGLREEAEVDHRKRLDVKGVVVGGGVRRGHGIAIRLRLVRLGEETESDLMKTRRGTE